MSDAADQAQAQYDSIKDMVVRNAEDEIHEDPLSVLVRSNWVEPGAIMTAEEYEILLCTGGPAVRIVGDLDEHSEPTSARLEFQDWFTPWSVFNDCDEEVLLQYVRYFCFG